MSISSYLKSQPNNKLMLVWFSSRQSDRQTDRQMNVHTYMMYRQINRQMDRRNTDGQTNRRKVEQTDRWTN